MSYTLRKFSEDCHLILKVDPGPVGREKVGQLLETLLMEDKFISNYYDSSIIWKS